MEADVSALSTAISQDGYGVVRGALPAPLLAAARERCLRELAATRLWHGGGTIVGHIGYRLPPDFEVVAPFVTHAAVTGVVAELLGPDWQLLSIGGNVNLPGSTFQPSHADGNMGLEYLIVNLPLGDVTEKNGSLEVFAGTHPTPMSFAEFCRANPPALSRRINTSSGDLLLRYPRLWHRGTPNRSTAPRFMIAALFGGASTDRDPMPLSPEAIQIIAGARVRARMEPATGRTGEFRPTYFDPGWKGLAKETFWRYAPAAYDQIRRSR